jgi:hypothetical protein
LRTAPQTNITGKNITHAVEQTQSACQPVWEWRINSPDFLVGKIEATENA